MTRIWKNIISALHLPFGSTSSARGDRRTTPHSAFSTSAPPTTNAVKLRSGVWNALPNAQRQVILATDCASTAKSSLAARLSAADNIVAAVRGNRPAFVFGIPGTGKSTALAQAQQTLASELGLTAICDFPFSTNDTHLPLSALLAKFIQGELKEVRGDSELSNIQYAPKGDLLPELERYHRERSKIALIALDEFTITLTDYPGGIEEAIAQFRPYPHLRLILAGHADVTIFTSLEAQADVTLIPVQPMSRAESDTYSHRIASANGCDFTNAGLEELFRNTGGNVRMTNTLLTQSAGGNLLSTGPLIDSHYVAELAGTLSVDGNYYTERRIVQHLGNDRRHLDITRAIATSGIPESDFQSLRQSSPTVRMLDTLGIFHHGYGQVRFRSALTAKLYISG